MTKLNINARPKIVMIEEEIHTLYLDGSVTCEECGSLMVCYKDGIYEQWECLSCGATIIKKKNNA